MNMSGDPEQEYFSDGITEDIITDLSKVSALSVVARNTAFTFKGHTVDVKEVAKTLGVDHVLEGSVRKAGNRVRITAQLIDGKEGDHHWADRYDRDLTDIFVIQDEISKEIVRALRLRLLPEEEQAIESRGTDSAQAYNLYLMARQQWIWGSWGNSRRDEAIVRICKQAVDVRPGLCAKPGHLWRWRRPSCAIGTARMKTRCRRPSGRCRSIAGLAEPHCVKVRVLEQRNRHEEADKELAEALRLGPDSWEVNRETARLMFRRDRMGDAIRYFEKASQLMDTDFHSCLMLQTCYLGVGDEPAALEAARRTLERAEVALAKDPTNGAALAAGRKLADHDRRGRAGEGLGAAGAAARSRQSDGPLQCRLRPDIPRIPTSKARSTCSSHISKRIDSPGQIRHAEIDPDMDSLRDDPRFKTMLAGAKQRLGMVEQMANPISTSL